MKKIQRALYCAIISILCAAATHAAAQTSHRDSLREFETLLAKGDSLIQIAGKNGLYDRPPLLIRRTFHVEHALLWSTPQSNEDCHIIHTEKGWEAGYFFDNEARNGERDSMVQYNYWTGRKIKAADLAHLWAGISLYVERLEASLFQDISIISINTDTAWGNSDVKYYKLSEAGRLFMARQMDILDSLCSLAIAKGTFENLKSDSLCLVYDVHIVHGAFEGGYIWITNPRKNKHDFFGVQIGDEKENSVSYVEPSGWWNSPPYDEAPFIVSTGMGNVGYFKTHLDKLISGLEKTLAAK